MTKTYLSGPALASLRASARMTENKLMRAGRYGPVLWHDRVAYVARVAVEHRIGQRFNDAQLALAVAGQPGRILILSDPEQEAV
jgi:hypothetical protein